jgi:hypothetical protein
MHYLLLSIRYSEKIKKSIPVGARFFAHVQTGPGAHPACCTMGTGSFPGVKRPERGADHPPSSKAFGSVMVYVYLLHVTPPLLAQRTHPSSTININQEMLFTGNKKYVLTV